MHPAPPLAVWMSRLLLASGALACLSCNTRTPVLDNPVIATAPTSWTAVPPNPPGAPKLIELAPGGTIGGGSGRGTVFFDFPAPEGGTTVSLTASDPVVRIMPSTVTVPGGALSTDFSYTTEPVTADKSVQVVASTPERSIAANLGVWAVLPTFFSYSSDRGAPVGGGRAGRFTPANARFSPTCRDNFVSVTVSSDSSDSFDRTWRVLLGAPAGVPLRPGTYENATDTVNSNFITIESVFMPSCREVGRFTVHESEFAVDGRVVRFWATFEQACAGQPGAIRGDLRLADCERR